MINQVLLLANVALLVLAWFLLRSYRRRYGQSYWQSFLSGQFEPEKIILLHTPLKQLGLGRMDKQLLTALKKHGCKGFLGFHFGLLENSYVILGECASRQAWATVFCLQGHYYVTLTAVSAGDEKKVVTVSNAPNISSKAQGRFVRLNHRKYNIPMLFERLDKLLPQRRVLTLKSYMQLSKKLFLPELLQAHRDNYLRKQLEIPGRYVQSHRQLIAQYAEKYHINPYFLQDNSHKILIVNNESVPDYLVANLVTACQALYPQRKMITAAAKGADDINQWFAEMNQRIDKKNRFHYLGSVGEGDKTDLYYHQYITLRYQTNQ